MNRESVLDQVISIENVFGETIETELDLNPYLEGGQGHLILLLELPPDVTAYSFCSNYAESRVAVVTWLQVTDLGLQGFADGTTLLTRVVDLTTGAPQASVKMQFESPQIYVYAETDSEGYASPDLEAFTDASERPTWFADQSGQDASLLPIYRHLFRNEMRIEHRWHLFSDRYLYRPGEEVQVKGRVRQVGFLPAGDVTWAQSGLSDIHYGVYDARGLGLDHGKTKLDSHGALDFRFQVPEDANSGRGRVNVQLSEPYGNEDSMEFTTMTFRIEEFRRPEFEVSLTMAEGPHLLQDPVLVEAQAAYYGGGGLAGASVNWQVSAQPARFKPPGWHRYEFGAAVPWWWGGRTSAQIQPQTLSAEMDVQGSHKVSITAQSEAQLPVSHVLQVEATIKDLSQQSLTAVDTVMVHPALWYVGGRTDSYVGRTDKPLPVQLIVTDLDGNPVEGQEIRVTTQRVSRRGTPVPAEAEARAAICFRNRNL